MGAMYRLKAYFGMVPAEDMAEYADEPPVERYAGRRREYAGDRWGDGEYPAEREYAAAPRDVRIEARVPEVRAEAVGQDHFVVVLRAGHPYAGGLDLGSYAAQPHVLVSFSVIVMGPR